jgi:hypothetical protein
VGAGITPPDGSLAEPPWLGPEVPVRWLSAAGVEALGLTGDALEATLYARLQVAIGPLVHRWSRAAPPVALEDVWLEKSAPGAARYRPVVGDRVSYRVRRGWVEDVAASVGVDRAEVTVVGWAVVWMPREAG